MTQEQADYIKAQENIFTLARLADDAVAEYKGAINHLREIEKKLTQEQLVELHQLF